MMNSLKFIMKLENRMKIEVIIIIQIKFHTQNIIGISQVVNFPFNYNFKSTSCQRPLLDLNEIGQSHLLF